MGQTPQDIEDLWKGLCKGEALCCQIRGRGEVRKHLKLDTHSPHKDTCLRERRKILSSWQSTGPPRPRSEWLLLGLKSISH
jgi:hypothetical protein